MSSAEKEIIDLVRAVHLELIEIKNILHGDNEQQLKTLRQIRGNTQT